MIKISTDRSLLDIEMIYQFLNKEAPWCKGIPKITVERAIKNSLCFAAYLDLRQIGFARIVSDFATFASLRDVFVLPTHRGNGVASLMLEAVNQHVDLQDLRRIMLASADQQGLYAKFGFTRLKNPDIFMEKLNSNVYLQKPIK
jgi:N-acetylglutamate synthase-like GNAT family acetyltransferase